MDNQTVAEQVYSAVFGHLDDKEFRASKTAEIEQWLDDGDPLTNVDIAALAGEWREYDALTVRANISHAAATLGRMGGSATSERKAASSAANGRKGGRPADLTKRTPEQIAAAMVDMLAPAKQERDNLYDDICRWLQYGEPVKAGTKISTLVNEWRAYQAGE